MGLRFWMYFRSYNKQQADSFMKTMKKFRIFLILVIVLSACKNESKGPDVSGIKIDLQIERFDQDFFAIDTNNIVPGLNNLHDKYPELTAGFLRDVLGLDSASTVEGVRKFLSVSKPLHDTIDQVFRTTEPVEKEMKQAFQHIKYYYPNYPLPHIATIAGPVDALAQSDAGPTPDFLRPGLLGISLQFYLGASFSVYHDPFFIENVAPEYRSRRFSKEYITADAVQLIINDISPDISGRRPLIEQMIEKGKRWWLLDKFMPGAPDSVKTGYTNAQLEWCKDNEGMIWSYLVKNEDLNSLNPTVIQIYIGEGPFTQGFSQELSPGNIGQWIGWQIVKKYYSKNNSITPDELMKMDPKKILEEAKYKPR
jgi:hypothetical protein